MNFIKVLNKAVEENPDAQIKFQVSEDTCFWEHSCLLLDSSITTVRVENLTMYDGKFLDEEELEDKLYYDADKDLVGEELELSVKVAMNRYKFENIIIVNLSS